MAMSSYLNGVSLGNAIEKPSIFAERQRLTNDVITSAVLPSHSFSSCFNAHKQPQAKIPFNASAFPPFRGNFFPNFAATLYNQANLDTISKDSKFSTLMKELSSIAYNKNNQTKMLLNKSPNQNLKIEEH